MDFKSLLLSLAFLVTIATCADQEENKSVQKRSAESDGLTEPIDGLAEGLEDDGSAADKRRLFRYGRGGLLRYGRGGLLRYGKRGGLMRYGKRSDEEEDYDTVDSAKRLFRWGKRSDDEADDFKRLFRWGKRDDESAFQDEAKRRLFRYGKRDGDKRIFRYGKRSGEEEEGLSDVMDEEKRRLFRYGKRDMDMDEAKRRLFRYGRDIDIRAPSQPHVPFRFGEKEE